MRSTTFLLISFFTIAVFISVSTSCHENHDGKKETAKTDQTPNRQLEHGKYLVTIAGCTDCHSNRQFKFFSGPIEEGTQGMGGAPFDHNLMGLPGVVYARNITSDTATGIGKWTDAEVIRAVTQGISRNGDSLFPLMPYDNFAQLAKQDILDIVAYIRTLPAINNKVPERKLFAPIAAFYRGIPNTLDQNKKPAASDKVAYGGYLVKMASCIKCHTPVNEKGEPQEPFSGGFTFHGPGFTVNTANLTPDSATGLGAWSEKIFLDRFRMYRESSAYLFEPKEKNTFMPWSEFAKLDDDDLSAIYAYLRSLKPIKHQVEKYPALVNK